jgi:hypothetical protein
MRDSNQSKVGSLVTSSPAGNREEREEGILINKIVIAINGRDRHR